MLRSNSGHVGFMILLLGLMILPYKSSVSQIIISQEQLKDIFGPNLEALHQYCRANGSKGNSCIRYRRVLGEIRSGDYISAYLPAKELAGNLENQINTDPAVLRDALKLVAHITLIIGHYIQALAFAERAYADGEFGDRDAKLLLAKIYLTIGRERQFKKLFNCDNLRNRETGSGNRIKDILYVCADYYLKSGQYFLAREYYSFSLSLLKRYSTEFILLRPLVLTAEALFLSKTKRNHGALDLLGEAEQHLSQYKKLFKGKAVTPEVLFKIGQVYYSLKKFRQARRYLNKALDNSNRIFLPSHPIKIRSKILMGRMLEREGKPLEAIEFYRTLRSTVVEDPATYIAAFREQVEVEKKIKRFSHANRHLNRIRYFISTEQIDKEHPIYIQNLTDRAHVQAELGHYSKALNLMRERRRLAADIQSNSAYEETSDFSMSRAHQLHTDLVLHPSQEGGRLELVSESFQTVQLGRTSSAGSAIYKMATRFASGRENISSIVRQLQDANSKLQILNDELMWEGLKPSHKRKKKRIVRLKNDLKETRSEIASLDREIKEKFPRYAVLTGRDPLSLSDTQKLLGDEEALVAFAGSYVGENTHVFVIRKDAQKVYTVDLELKEMKSLVDRIRKGLSPQSAFDVGASHELYERLLGPAEETLKGVRHLIFVPGGPLMSIPFGLLATGPGDGTSTAADAGTVRDLGTSSAADSKKTSSPSGYASVPWLARKYALTMLPSIASLKSLRLFAKKSTARGPFVGFGDPMLEGNLQKCKDVRGGVDMVSLFRGGVADVGKVRELCPLPKTSYELNIIAKFLKADKGQSLYLRERATESMVKKVKLNDSKVIAFATHGLLSMETRKLGSVVEPALVLTPPDKATEEDDGLLTASEIAQLKMNADFVILSACNTAAGEEGNAEGLSGLAKAFFYAGARSLLVSHWPVESKAATKLTTTLFKNLKDNPELSRAEAFRRSMMSLASVPETSHPFFWAPFSVVGEGR